jgi:hypothetical protein
MLVLRHARGLHDNARIMTEVRRMSVAIDVGSSWKPSMAVKTQGSSCVRCKTPANMLHT